MPFVEAEKARRKAKIVIDGASGSGKTVTALKIGQGLCSPGGRIAVIDSENGRSQLCAGSIPFLVDILSEFHPDRYIDAMHEASRIPGVEVVIVDSLSHAWGGPGGILELVDNSNGSKFSNGWGNIGTPLWNRLVQAVVNHPTHLIVTARSKMTYAQELDDRGKTQIVKLGLQPVLRDGFEYEADWVFRVSHTSEMKGGLATVTKTPLGCDITGTFMQPGPELGVRIREWLSAGVRPRNEVVDDLRAALAEAKQRGVTLSGAPTRHDVETLPIADLEERLAGLRETLSATGPAPEVSAAA